jgi:polysaccharide biosynthesis/export protein
MSIVNYWNLVIARFFLVVFTALALGACANDSNSPVLNDTFTASGSDKIAGSAVGTGAGASASKIFAANTSNANVTPNEDYKIAPLDVLDVSVYGVADLTRTVQVSSTGMISMPLVKTVKAGGRTTGQLERDIATKLSATYLQSPQVSVSVKEFNSQRITVDGAVMKPGIFPTTGQVSLMQAIALAQGLTTVADPSAVIIFRQQNNKRMAARFDLRKVRTGKTPDPVLQAGDIVMVDESSGKTALRDVTNVLPISGLFQLLTLL